MLTTRSNLYTAAAAPRWRHGGALYYANARYARWRRQVGMGRGQAGSPLCWPKYGAPGAGVLAVSADRTAAALSDAIRSEWRALQVHRREARRAAGRTDLLVPAG